MSLSLEQQISAVVGKTLRTHALVDLGFSEDIYSALLQDPGPLSLLDVIASFGFKYLDVYAGLP
jgi:hypothetical protein